MIRYCIDKKYIVGCACKAGLICLFFLISGCAVIDIDETEYVVDDNRVINKDNLNNIVVGETTDDWVLTHIGYPKKQTVDDNNNVLFSYTLERRNVKRTRLVLLYRSRKLSVTKETLHIEFNNKKVTRYWVVVPVDPPNTTVDKKTSMSLSKTH